jgi:hypothetical protein
MFNLNDYETVDERIHKFWDEFLNGRIITELVETVRAATGEPLQYVVKALVYRNADDVNPMATGYAEEVVGSSHINKTSALENAETSAIGRALANAGFSTKGSRPSQTEMAKVQNVEAIPPSRRDVPAPNPEAIPVKGTDVVIKNPNDAPSEKQTALLESRTSKLGINGDFYQTFWRFVLAGGQRDGNAPITKGEASQIIGMDKDDFAGYANAFMASLFENEAPF